MLNIDNWLVFEMQLKNFFLKHLNSLNDPITKSTTVCKQILVKHPMLRLVPTSHEQSYICDILMISSFFTYFIPMKSIIWIEAPLLFL